MVDVEKIDGLLRSINSATRNTRLYPPGHPAIATQLTRALQSITEILKTHTKQRLFIGKLKDVLVFDETPIMDAEEKLDDFLHHMEDKGVEGIIFENGILAKEFASFIAILAGEEDIKGSALQKKLHAEGVKHITLKSIPFGKRTLIEIYNDTIGVVQDVLHEVRLGKIPKSDGVLLVVGEMSNTVLSNKNAMIGLTMIKNYDNYLYNHSVNVSILTLALAQTLKYEKEDLMAAGIGGLLHDVGKTGVSEDIIKKPGGLSDDEWKKIREHPVLGAQIIERMKGLNKGVAHIVHEHHIRYDRSGYPKTDSPLHPIGMIVTLADAYDALTTLRVYQRPYHPAEAIKILNSLSGKHFEPDIMKAFINMLGVYPMGTMVRLTTNEIAIVTKINQDDGEHPVVKVVYGSDGQKLASPLQVDLSHEDETARFIVSPVDPLNKGINMGAFFEEEVGSLEVEG
ncbi:MAG: HD-GYP domain-containing protein [Deltaproteobacteria bacterium]|nr:HD-GYP domain-containing protein [Deltaproteobacteria bacterium]